jgi:signal transduction histidine kinase
MPSSHSFKFRLPVPRSPEMASEMVSTELSLESVLADLPLYEFQVESYHTGIEVARVLEQNPTLPGVVLLEQGQFLGLISRRCLLEYLIRPQGMGLFLPSSLSVLHSYARSNALILADSTPILAAAQLALRRPHDQQSEPIVVKVNAATYKLLDVHELHIAYWQIRGIETQVRYERAQTQMVQTEKMASLGRLVDGVAHEILDPVGFIWGNLAHLSDYTQQVMEMLTIYERHFPDLPAEITQLREEIELDYLRNDLPQTITSIRAGAERLKNLVTSLQNFCHIDDVYPKPANIHECLDGLLLLLKSRLKGEIQIVKHYGHLPPVTCYSGQLNQVFMNILTNAIDALLNQSAQQDWATELRGATTLAAKPQITLTTQIRPAPADHVTSNQAAISNKQSDENHANPVSTSTSRWVRICIADNGPGISAEKCQQILDSFSVENRADKETSLALSYQIITAKHSGKFYLRSQPKAKANKSQAKAKVQSSLASGTEFEIWLPLI